MILVSAHASILNITYTDIFSDSATLTLTGTPAADGGLTVTNVTGFFDGSAVDGPLSGYGTSNEFYTDPSMLASQTVDSGFVFETAGGAEIVSLYAYNYYGLTGYGTDTDMSTKDEQSGAAYVTILSSSSAPEPATAALGFGALALMAGWRKFAVRRG
jgi:hypothetical protein